MRTPDQNIEWFDEAWSDPEFVKSCKQLLPKTSARSGLIDKIPSFSLGATQRMEVDLNVGVNAVTLETECLVNAMTKGASTNKAGMNEHCDKDKTRNGNLGLATGTRVYNV
ncbi:uncharacterized protein LOC130997681 [Salvia miltiorrhiza]|uniref:uncharacterized protein LOC130997681 n=1 Tax=Salvia miltiorrhiza TaxID=226208 RepID=UPI0025AD584C|nr:uncharacterized protein LOC130997681 [Salvia miltiorrhiza]